MKISKQDISVYLKKIGDKYNFDLNYYATNGFWVGLAYFFSSIFGIAVSMAFANFTTKETYGQYSLILSIISIVGIISVPGLSTSVVQSVARGREQVFLYVLKKRLKYSLLVVVILMLVSMVYYYMDYSSEFALALILVSIFFPTTNVFSSWRDYLQGKSQFKELSINNILINIAVSVITILVIYYFSNSVIIIVFSSVIISSIFNIIYILKYTKKSDKLSGIDTESIKYGYFLNKLNISSLILNHIDKIIIGFIDLKMLAVYTIALKLLDLVKGGSKSLYQLIFPRFAASKIRIKVIHLIILALMGLLLSLVLCFSIEFIVTSIYTYEYVYSAYFFKKIVWVSVLFLPITYLHGKSMGESNRNVISFIQIYNPAISLVICVLVYMLSNSLEYFLLTKIYFVRIINFITLYIFNFNRATK